MSAEINIEPDSRRSFAELCRRSFSLFTMQSWHVLEPTDPLEWNWHLEVLCDHLQALIEDWIRVQLAKRELIQEGTNELAEVYRLGLVLHMGKVQGVIEQRIRNLIVNVPPGTAKSRVVSVKLPAWVWTRWPSWRSRFLSVNPSVALRDSVFCRDLILSEWYQLTFEPAWKLSADQDTKSKFKNTAGGSRAASGYYAKIVGDRDDAIFIDDPNDPEDVHSPKARAAANSRYDNTLKNRVNDLRSSPRLIIQQRVHDDDLTGHILAKDGEIYSHLRLTMEREALDDKKGCECLDCQRGYTAIGWRDTREPGELMFPRRFPESVLASFRKNAYVWSSQYQQRPIPTAGNMFRPECWRFWRLPSEPDIPEFAERTVILPDFFEWKALSWDCAFKGKASSDPVAGGAWGGVGAFSYLLDLEWDRMDVVATMERLEAQSLRHPDAGEVLVEDAANGPAVVRMMQGKIRGLVAVSPQGGKPSRAAATAGQQAAGQIFLPLHAVWRDRYIAQHTAFPYAANDDVVDQQSQVLLHRMGMPSGSLFISRPDEMPKRRM